MRSLALVVFSISALAQERFVTSVKAASSQAGVKTTIEISPVSLTMRQITLKRMIEWAYNVQDFQLAGESLPDSAYDVVARTDPPSTVDEFRAALQAVLRERFHLALHHEPKAMGVLALLASKDVRIERSKVEGAVSSRVAALTISFERASMTDLAALLTERFRTPVVDMTGLQGQFDFKIDASPYLGKDVPREKGMTLEGAVFYAAVQDQRGLKFERRKSALDVLVIDHHERLSEN